MLPDPSRSAQDKADDMIPSNSTFREPPILAPLPQGPALFGLSRSAIYRAAAAGQIRLVKQGRRTYIDSQTALLYIASLPIFTPRRDPRRAKNVA